MEILTRFLRWRPTLNELQERNIIKGKIDTTKNALEKNHTKRKLINMLSHRTLPKKSSIPFPIFGISPTQLQAMYPNQPNGIPRVLSDSFAYVERSMFYVTAK